MRAAPLAIVAAALLAACSQEGDGTSIRVTGEGDGGAPASVSANGATGAVRVDVPGFKADIALPRVRLDAGNFDLNGVRLYPGSSIGDVSIDGGRGGDGTVRIRFSSPAAPDAVRNWFAGRLTHAGYTLTELGSGLRGTDDKGQPFRMDLTPAGDGRSDGTITITD